MSVDTPLRNLLEAHKTARLQVPTPVVATRVVPPQAGVEEWATLLEQQPSRITRRIALTRALASISEEEGRKRVVGVVCRAELGPLFAHVDGLPPTARMRHLERAIVDIRSDNIPDALRDAQLRELFDRS